MNLISCFTTLCQQLGVSLRVGSPSVKALTTGKKNIKHGVVARYSFNDFYMDIYYIEKIKGDPTRQLIWITFGFSNEPTVIFSLYDILSATLPECFSCYTFSYVDSPELMKDCFREIHKLLENLIPSLCKLAENGIQQNRLIAQQKQKINEYFRNDIFEAARLDGGEKLFAFLMQNFLQFQIDTYTIGSPALFFSGKEEKALKHLRKAKFRTLYEDALLSYLENGGKAPTRSATVDVASPKEGNSRQGTDGKGVLKIFFYTLLLEIPVCGVMLLIYFILVHLTARDAVYIFGITENMFLIPSFALLTALLLASNIFFVKKSKNSSFPEANQRAGRIIKYLTVFGECISLVLLLTCCVNSTVVLNNSDFFYSEADFTVSRNTCQYSSVEYIALIEGYTYNNEFCEAKHIVFVTKSGNVINLENSTFNCAENFTKETFDFFKERNIEIKKAKTIEELHSVS